MKYTAYQHRPGIIKVETNGPEPRVICDTINNLEMAERIAAALNLLDGATPEDIGAVEALLAMRQGMRAIDSR